jgi:hypothetical protein
METRWSGFRSISSSMTETEIKEVLQGVDAGLRVFEKHEGRLTGSEISVKSMLLALRLQLTEQLKRTRDLTGK